MMDELEIPSPFVPPPKNLENETPRNEDSLSVDDDDDDDDDDDYTENTPSASIPKENPSAAASSSNNNAPQIEDDNNYWNLPCSKKRSFGLYLPEVDSMGMPRTEVTYNKNGEKEIGIIGGSIHRNDAVNSVRFEITVKAIPSQPLLVQRSEDLLNAVAVIYEKACSAIEETAVVKDILALDGIDPTATPYAPMTPGYGTAAAAYAPYTPSAYNCTPPFTPESSSSNEKI